MCILASPALGPGVAVERRRVAAPVAAATARAPGRHGVRAAPGGVQLMARHVLAILSAVHGAERAHGALHPTAVEVGYEGSERVRLKVLPTCLLRFS